MAGSMPVSDPALGPPPAPRGPSAAPAGPAAPPPRLESLTGLRFVAALAVFSLHLALLNASTPYAVWMLHYVVQGGAGVSFFFILSGFVLTWSHPARDTAGRFYRRRAARILPNHVLTWIGMGVVLGTLAKLPRLGPALGSLFLVQAWVPSEKWFWAMNTPAWSLGCEAFFYALFPALLPALRRLKPAGRRVLLVATVELVLCIALLAGPAVAGTRGYWLMYFFPVCRLVEFVAGILLALELRSGAWPRVPLSLAAVVALGAYLAAGRAPAAFQNVAVTFVPFGLLIVAAAQRDIRSGGRRPLMARRVPVVLGRWSFAFYLVHYPILTAFGYFELHHRPLAGWAAAGNALVELGVCLVAAGLVYTVVEHPLERLLRPRARRPGVPSPHAAVLPAA